MKELETSGYRPFWRRNLLDVLRKHKTGCRSNAIFSDFLTHLERLEEQTCSYAHINVKDWNYFAWEGFLQSVQDGLGDPEFEWGYVPNPTGGFLGAWWCGGRWGSWDTYLQIEEDRLCMKMAWQGDDQGADSGLRANWRDQWHAILKHASVGSSIQIVRPSRLGNGWTMSAAWVGTPGEWIQRGHDGLVDMDATLRFLRQSMAVLDRARELDDTAAS